jgi:hypothetical protein
LLTETRRVHLVVSVLGYIFLAVAESISHLADNQTVELFYLQARSLIWRGLLEVESDIVFQLAALGLQAAHGDYQARFCLYVYYLCCGSGMFIPDPNFFHHGSRVKRIPASASKNLSILTQKIVSNVHPGSVS